MAEQRGIPRQGQPDGDDALYRAVPSHSQGEFAMAYGKSRGRSSGRKSGGFMGNLTKLGGSRAKLALKSDMRTENMKNPKAATKQAHKRA
jgi:hypothetical protein